jgi:hypothetical protein
MKPGPKTPRELGRAADLKIGEVAVDLSAAVRASLAAYLDNEILKAAALRNHAGRGDVAEIKLELLQEIRKQLLGTRLRL